MSNDVEDYFEDSLSSIFDDVTVAHGVPGDTIVYDSIHGPITLHLTKTDTWEEQLKFSHFLWNV